MPAKQDTDAVASPRCKLAFKSSIALERAAISCGVASLSNARVFASRFESCPPTIIAPTAGARLHPHAAAVGRSWIRLTQHEHDKLSAQVKT